MTDRDQELTPDALSGPVSGGPAAVVVWPVNVPMFRWCCTGCAATDTVIGVHAEVLAQDAADRHQCAPSSAPHIVVDGDVLREVVLDACPELISDSGARQIADRVLAGLAAADGVLITRGQNSQPWTADGAS